MWCLFPVSIHARAPIHSAGAVLQPGSLKALIVCMLPCAAPMVVSFGARASTAIAIAAVEEFVVGWPSTTLRLFFGALFCGLGTGLAAIAAAECVFAAIGVLIIGPASALLRPTAPRDLLSEARHDVGRALRLVSELPVERHRLLLEARALCLLLGSAIAINDVSCISWGQLDAALLRADAAPFLWYNPICLLRGCRLPMAAIIRYATLTWATDRRRLLSLGLSFSRCVAAFSRWPACVRARVCVCARVCA